MDLDARHYFNQKQLLKCKARADKGVLSEIMEQGIYKILVGKEDRLLMIVPSTHVTFDESLILGTLIHPIIMKKNSDSTFEDQSVRECIDLTSDDGDAKEKQTSPHTDHSQPESGID